MLLTGAQERGASCLKELASLHACASHPLFDYLRERFITPRQAVSLLANYDAHAALLRRLLLKAAAIMPEPAVGFILENVRNEYGNGDYSQCHQNQLLDLKECVRRHGNLPSETVAIEDGVKQYIVNIGRFYTPEKTIKKPEDEGRELYGPAIAAGAITATELMAIEEFKAMQVAFANFGLADHIWFDHVSVECEHGEESLSLAEYFFRDQDASTAVEFGFNATLDCNVYLYDGLLSAMTTCDRN